MKLRGKSRKNEFGGGKDRCIHRDVGEQFGWYARNAGIDVAWRFYEAVERTIERLRIHPPLGRPRAFLNVRMQGIRSIQGNPPFERFLIFYKVDHNTIVQRRLISGERDLPRRVTDR